jgi:nitric oxide reductase subunit C
VTKADTRRFFVWGTVLCTVAFVALTVHSHRTVLRREHSQTLDDEVRRGLRVWMAYNCENCHTLLGEGAYFAPDLTQIVAQRGATYLAAFLEDPSKFYSEERHGRLMPTLGLAQQEITDVIAFLEFVGGIDTQRWPPRPIRVTGTPAGLPGAGGAVAAAPSDDPGRKTFEEAGCAACHSLEPEVALVGPSLAGVATRAEERLRDPGYAGQASDVASYLRESIAEPSAYIVPPQPKHATPAGVSFMPSIYSATLSPQAAEDLVAYLLTLR